MITVVGEAAATPDSCFEDPGVVAATVATSATSVDANADDLAVLKHGTVVLEFEEAVRWKDEVAVV